MTASAPANVFTPCKISTPGPAFVTASTPVPEPSTSGPVIVVVPVPVNVAVRATFASESTNEEPISASVLPAARLFVSVWLPPVFKPAPLNVRLEGPWKMPLPPIVKPWPNTRSLTAWR